MSSGRGDGPNGAGLISSPEAMDLFDALCKVIGRRRKGFSLSQIGDAHALARELLQEEPDWERVALLTRRLELTPEELQELTEGVDVL